MYGLPIKKIQFHTEHNHDLVLSMDAQVCTLVYLAYLPKVPTTYLPTYRYLVGSSNSDSPFFTIVICTMPIQFFCSFFY
jgi:hypothetical protein